MHGWQCYIFKTYPPDKLSKLRTTCPWSLFHLFEAQPMRKTSLECSSVWYVLFWRFLANRTVAPWNCAIRVNMIKFSNVSALKWHSSYQPLWFKNVLPSALHIWIFRFSINHNSGAKESSNVNLFSNSTRHQIRIIQSFIWSYKYFNRLRFVTMLCVFYPIFNFFVVYIVTRSVVDILLFF